MKDLVWRCRDGTLIPVLQMQTSHIENCIRMIQASGGRWRARYLERLQMELNYRNSQGRR